MSNRTGQQGRTRGGGDRGSIRGGSESGGRGQNRGEAGGQGRGDGSTRGFRGFRGGDSPRARGLPQVDRGGRGRGQFSSRGGGARGGVPIFREGTHPQIDQRLKQQDLDALIASFGSLKLTDPNRPLRPGFGKDGKLITVRGNFFPVRIPNHCLIYDYRVEISPKIEKREEKSWLFNLLEESAEGQSLKSHIAHDRSSRLVSSKKLPQPLTVDLPMRREGESNPGPNTTVYRVSIVVERILHTNKLTQYMTGQPKNRDEYDPAPLISALNLVLQDHATRTGVRIGRQDDGNYGSGKFFFPFHAQRPPLLGPGVIAVQGYFLSSRPVHKELMVNVNACMGPFLDLPDTLAEALRKFNQTSKGGMLTLPNHIKGSLKVTTSYRGYKRRHKVFDIVPSSAERTFFKHAKHGNISVKQYFHKEYKIRLEHPNDLPVVDVRSRADKSPVFIPAELCTIEPGQPFRGKLTGDMTKKMIKEACRNPKDNAELIVGDGFSKLALEPPLSPQNSFGITVDKEMAVIPARELPPPRIVYGPQTVNARDGKWNIVNAKFHRTARVNSWAMLVINDGEMENFVKGLEDPRVLQLRDAFIAKLRGCGMQLSNPTLVIQTERLPLEKDWKGNELDYKRRRGIEIIRKKMNDIVAQKPDFVLVLLAYTDSYIYPGIKTIGDLKLGLKTICIQVSKAMKLRDGRLDDQYLSNVALKVNTKLGGVNHQLDKSAMAWLLKKKTMLVGIDVTHRGPGSKAGAPSIAAVVASVDDEFIQYPASLRIQQTHDIKEMVGELDLEEMMVERLLAYEKKNRKLPERIFVFRDGVSEGQYDTVLTEELPAIIKAFRNQKLNTARRGEPYRPLISIIVCGKRHHARFFATDAQNADPKTGNTRPGTVVDSGVTGIFDFDFYLQAHAGIQGTVKSTHYVVIYDETRFTADEIQGGTNNVSYLYARATRSVSLIPPAYYADLACERGRCFLNEFLVGNEVESDKGSVSSVGNVKGKSKSTKEAEQKRVFEDAKKAWGDGIHPNVKDVMFYI
ncbi:hypothetical protein E1B28_002000 [Marasmius oreades]|uniref:Piwi-domain-containing protein n=1 Tax=Marasmius oreades TaxID=181124 RepID=A0A9P7V4I2_9AGAR|nr:uncharacterized protein E1B28_002000 [Marasmius oreades]KAG7100225.1 hypothetical protein E1B28_002000 [Marasmius oreades]